MATFEAYIVGAITYAVWMVGYVILRTYYNEVIPIISMLGDGFMTQPTGWMQTILSNWVLVGLIGIFFAIFAASITSARTGGAY